MPWRAVPAADEQDMLEYPDINPVAISLGPLDVHWYGLMYLLGFAVAWALGIYRARQPHTVFNEQQVGDLIFFGIIGLIVGARVGYILFYDFASVMANPLNLFAVWQGGMSFHGGLIGCILAVGYMSWRDKVPFWAVGDFVAPLAVLGIGFGRIGNFINGELWGRVTDVPWGMVFPGAGPDPRHPSQLYEAFLEGLVLFVILWLFSRQPRPIMSVSGLFLLLYGVFRFSVEFVREPDAHLGFVAFGWMSMGQVLTLPLMIAGAVLLFLAWRNPVYPQPATEHNQK